MTLDPANELAVDCAGCGQPVIVCCYIDDLDPEAYRCLRCRPLVPAERPADAGTLTDVMERARSSAHAR